MRAIAPVYKKRQYTTHAGGKRICKFPGDLSSVGLPPVSHSHRSEFDQFASRRFRKVFEIVSLNSPGNEIWLLPRVDAEYFYFIATQNLRIRSDDFQVAALTEPDQCIPGAVYRMTAAGDRIHAKVFPHKSNAQVQVGRCEHKVVDACRQ